MVYKGGVHLHPPSAADRPIRVTLNVCIGSVLRIRTLADYQIRMGLEMYWPLTHLYENAAATAMVSLSYGKGKMINFECFDLTCVPAQTFSAIYRARSYSHLF